MLLIGSHVSFRKDTQLLGAVKESINYGSTTFMFYTGAPQNTNRERINSYLTEEAISLGKKHNIDMEKVIVHAPYIINLANKNEISKYEFSINFLKQECKRCEDLKVKYLVLHPGSHVGCGIDTGIKNIAFALNMVLKTTNTIILLETMAGKGTEVGSTFEEIEQIINLVDEKDKIGVCLDTCHLSDSGYDIDDFDDIILKLKEKNLFDKVFCIHVNDSKNVRVSHKDRHENIGFGHIGFNTLLKIIYSKEFENVPKILETPWVEEYPPYKEEIEMIRNKEFNPDMINKIKENN